MSLGFSLLKKTILNILSGVDIRSMNLIEQTEEKAHSRKKNKYRAMWFLLCIH